MPESIRRPDYASDGIPKSERKLLGKNKIEALDAKGQAGMRKVCALAREVLDIAAREVRPGVTTDYIDEVVHKACIERNVSCRLNMMQIMGLILLHTPMATGRLFLTEQFAENNSLIRRR